MKDLIAGTVAYVKEVLQGAEGGHDWFHTERVWKMARYIREMEDRGDLAVIEPAALLHDIADPKFFEGDLEKGPQMAFDFLDRAGLDSDRVRLVTGIIRNISFKGGIICEPVNSVEFGIVQDADRLDAMGAIGIARAFHYGGFRNRPIHDPSVPFREYRDTNAYYSSDAPTINHFHEKLLRLKDLMNTSTGRRLAEERHNFMLEFLERFYDEWDPGKPDDPIK